MSQYVITILMCLAACATRLDAMANTTINIDNWRVSSDIEPAPQKTMPLDYHWANSLALSTAHYQGTFQLTPQPGYGDDLFLVIPPIWCHNKVALNDILLTKTLVGSIYADNIIRIPASTLAPSNTLKLELFGDGMRCRVRGESVIVTNDPKILLFKRIRNLLLNDIHQVLTIVNILIIILCLSFISIKELRQPMIVLIVALVTQIPHNLLTGDLYNNLIKLDNPVTPFYLQLACQCVVWPMAIYFYYLTLIRKSDLPSRVYYAVIAGITAGGLVISSLIFINAAWFHVVFNIFITTLLLSFLGLFFALRVHWILALCYLSSLVTFSCSAISELWGLNLYLMGHGWLLMNSIALYLIVSKLKHSYFLSVLSNNIVGKFIPRPCYDRIHQAIEQQVNKGRCDDAFVISQTAGKGFISTVLIDICDWGILSSFDRSRLQPKLIYRARLKTFSEIEKIAQNFGIDLVKSQGDNLKYSCGLYSDHEDREHAVADKTLGFIVELIDSTDKINAILRAENLPYFEIKISASMGSNDYGIEQYLQRIQFDTIGNEVNIAYRLESAMNQAFYEQFGRNVALVHESLLAFCTDASLIEKFTTPFIVQDKHEDYQYKCLVYLFDKREVSMTDLTQQLGSFFVAASVDPTQKLKAVPKVAASAPDNLAFFLNKQEKRAISRQISYVGEKVVANLAIGDSLIPSEIIDFSPQNIGVVIKKADCPIPLQENQEIEVKFEIVGQEFSSKGLLIRVSDDMKIRQTDCISVGIKLIPPDRSSAERNSKRFAAREDFYPTASARSPFSLRNHISFKVMDIAADGLGLIPLEGNSHGLLVGLTLDLTIFVPLVDKLTCSAKIWHITPHEGNQLVVGVKILDNLDKFGECMALYLLNLRDENISLAKLRQEGFLFSEIRQVLTVAYKENDSDMKKIAELRKRVLKDAGELVEDEGADCMLDAFDAHARHLMISHKDRIIAAARVVFNDGDEAKMEHLSYNARIPEWLMGKKFVEFSRVCIDKDYRNADVFGHILFHMGKVTMESEHEWVVMSCHERLMKYYHRFGFQQVGQFESAEGKPWLLGACNMKAAIGGGSFLPLGYTVAFEACMQELKEQGILDQGFFSLVNTSFMKALKPIVLRKIKQYSKSA